MVAIADCKLFASRNGNERAGQRRDVSERSATLSWPPGRMTSAVCHEAKEAAEPSQLFHGYLATVPSQERCRFAAPTGVALT